MLDLEKHYRQKTEKEFEYAYPLHEGENKLEVTVYNESGIAETFRVKVSM